MMNKIIKIDENDNVAVALSAINKNEKIIVDGQEIKVKQKIPCGHKIALSDIGAGSKIIKYGYPIGSSKSKIERGSLVHLHNIRSDLKAGKKFKYKKNIKSANQSEKDEYFFSGYRRPNGDIGIRNEIWIIPLVGCVSKVSERIASQFNKKNLPDNIDGVHAFTHPYGCSQLGNDELVTQKILAGLVKHPNAGGVLVVGLGCENNNAEKFKKVLGKYNNKRVRLLIAQETGDEIKSGIDEIKKLIKYASGAKRTKEPASKLKIGLKCGGSDGFSGLTANPLAGRFSERVVSYGGSAILTEVPEIFGAEEILLNRCASKKVFDKAVRMIDDYKKYFIDHGQTIYENPSPGNKAGGISTLEEKSIGAVQKAGDSLVTDVLDYGDQTKKSGVSLLNGPGNDPVSITNLTAAGAHLILFTTGRGTMLGAPVPTVKISSNSALARKKPHWIDFDAGELAEGQMDLTEKLFDLVLDISSGRIMTKNEINNYREIAIFKDGVTL